MSFIFTTGEVVTIDYDKRGTHLYKAKFLELCDFGDLGIFARVELLDDLDFFDRYYDIHVKYDKGLELLEPIETVKQDSLSFFRSKMS